MAVEDFYPDPDRVRAEALGLDYEEPETLVGWRTKPFHPRGVRARIERVLRARVTRWPGDPEDNCVGNGSFFFGLSSGRLAETPGVHFDEPARYVTMVIYLTPSAAPDAGTSLWLHRPTGLTAVPTPADARRLGATVDELVNTLEEDSTRPRKWVEVDRVGNVYNRAVFYRSALLHSATRHFGSSLRNGRLYQTFRFGVRWH
jgi:hypothetical protein